jgi:nitrite reductase/ring-hydroxylating ferredoxin subunit
MVAAKRLICVSAELVDGGSGVRFEVAGSEGPIPAFVVRFCGRVHAYFNRCGHTPVELDWKPGEFFDLSGLYLICATHGALFDPATGACLGGRCNGRGLDALRVVEENGEVYLIQEGH